MCAQQALGAAVLRASQPHTAQPRKWPRGSTGTRCERWCASPEIGRWCPTPSHRRPPPPPRSGRLSARARLSRVAATTRETTTIAERAAAGALKGSGPFPLLDPTKGYSHVSPGVCDACADDVEARRAWVRVPPPQPRVPSSRHLRALHPPTPDPRLGARANPTVSARHPTASRIPLTRCSPPHAGGSSAGPAPLPPRQRRAHPRVSGRRRAGDDFLRWYRAWEADYEATSLHHRGCPPPPPPGATLPRMTVDGTPPRAWPRRPLRRHEGGGEPIAAAVFPAVCCTIDDARELGRGEDVPDQRRQGGDVAPSCRGAPRRNLFDAGAAAA